MGIQCHSALLPSASCQVAASPAKVPVDKLHGCHKFVEIVQKVKKQHLLCLSILLNLFKQQVSCQHVPDCQAASCEEPVAKRPVVKCPLPRASAFCANSSFARTRDARTEDKFFQTNLFWSLHPHLSPSTTSFPLSPTDMIWALWVFWISGIS